MKSKRLLLMLLMALMVPWAANAQSAQSLSQYSVTTGTETYTSIVNNGGTLLESVTGDAGSQTVALPFNFSFGESAFTSGTTLTVRADGYLYFGSSGPGHSSKTAWTSTTNYQVIAPFLNYDGRIDRSGGPDGGAYYAVVNDASNNPEMLVIEFVHLECYYSPYGDYNFQVRLHKSGNISTVYGESTLSTYTNTYGGEASHNFFLTDGMSDKVCLEGSYASPTKGTPTTLPNFTTAPVAGQVITYVRPIVSCPKPLLSEVAEADITPTTATVRWTTEATDQAFGLYWSTTSTLPENAEPMATAPAGSTSYQITGLTSATQYYVWLRGDCGGGDITNWTTPKSFITACAAINAGYTCGFEGPNTGGTTSYPLPACWSKPTGTNTTYPYAYNYNTYAHNGTRSLYFYGSTSTTQQIAVMPEIDGGVNGKRLSLYARLSSTSATGGLSIGYMTDPTNASTFHEVAPLTLTASYPATPYKVDFSGIEGNVVYMAIKSTLTNSYSIYVDDVALSNTPSCMEPTGLAEVENTATGSSVQLTWTSASSVHNWKLQYKKNGTTAYTTVEVAESELVNGAYTLSGLDASSLYNVRVAAWCGYPGTDPEDMSEYTATIDVSTSCEAVTTFPWNENFESYSAGNFDAPCWVNEHISGTGTQIFKVYTSTNGTNSTHQLQLPDMSSGTLTKLRLPEMTLPSNNYQFVIDVYRNASTQNYAEGIRVFVSTNGEIEGATELAFISRSYATSDGNLIPTESGTGWYTYELPLNISGTCYVILRGESKYGSATYMDNFAVEEISTCLRPSALMLATPSSRTAHTATLKWTNGSEEQTAWQIVYDTVNFSTDTLNLMNPTFVNVTTNPDTLTGLKKSKTYYAYVRANCGTPTEPEYGPWCRKAGTFTTLAGNTTPSGLVIDQASITSSSATAHWNPAAAGNDYHQSFELYYSTWGAMPNPLAADSLITGITDTLYTFTGLLADTTYYVWLRDNCGIDGYSNWTSRISFNTAAACQLPDGLQESDVTTNSAVITWNTYGQTGFNLRYSTDGETWIPKNNVTTPYELTGLTANTSYQVQVQAQCNLEEWSATLNIRTDCVPMTITETNFINEGFEDYEGTAYNANGVIPYCWDSYADKSQSSSPWYDPHIIGSGSYYYVHGGTKALTFYGKGNCYAALPEFTNSFSELQVSFWMAVENTSNGTLTLGYITAEDENYNTFTVIETYENTGANHVMVERHTYLSKKNIPSTATRLVFRWFYSGQYSCCIDDVVVKLAPSCYPVGSLAYDETSVTSNSVILTWTLLDNTQDAWQLCLNGDETNLRDVALADVTISNDTVTYVLSGLNASSEYTAKVRAYCSETDQSIWSNEVSFATACGVFEALGYSENFDSFTVPDAYTPSSRILPNCWNYINNCTNSTYKYYPTIYYYSYTNYANSTPNCLRFLSYYSSYGSYDPNPQYAILPQMDDLAGLQVTLQARGSNANSTFFVGTMSDPTDATTFTAINGEQSLTTTYAEYTFVIPEGTRDQYLAIMIAAATSSRTTNGVYIDDIVITEAPTCPKPTGFEVTATTTTTATFNWIENGTATAWQICLNGDETNLHAVAVADVTISNDTVTYVLSGLTASTNYTAKVRAYCNETDQSDWSNEMSFTTECGGPYTITETTPYTQDFESPVVTTTYGQVGVMPVCWDNYPATYASAKILAAGATYNYATEGQVLYFYGSGNNYAALPEFTNPLNKLQISFKWATESSSYGKLTLGYITDEDENYNSFMPIKEYAASSTSYHILVPDTLTLDTLPATAARLVFRWYYSSQWGCNVDDVEVSLAPVTTVTVPIALTEGWNWVSLPIEVDNPAAALEMLEDALDGNALTITSGTGQYTEYDDEDEEWFGNLTGIVNENMYMINMANDYTITLEGLPANPASHQITINPGWNWIGFPSNVEISVVAAFADFEAEEDDELRGREGATIFDGEEWFGFLDTLTPGHGYMYFFNGSEPKPLVIPTGAKARRIPGLGNPKK